MPTDPLPKSAVKLQDLKIERGNTEIGVNEAVLKMVVERFPEDRVLKALDLPCGNLVFLECLQKLYPGSELIGAEITSPSTRPGVDFIRMDLSGEFALPNQESFDLITSISGVMVFGNTQFFIKNCVQRLKKGGVFIVTNDNSMTIMDRLRYLLFGRVRMFNPVYENDEGVTQNIPIMELVRLFRVHGLKIEAIEYTSIHPRDLIYLPFALLVYPFQFVYLHKKQSALGKKMRWRLYPFRHLLCRHYVIVGRKLSG